MTRTDWIECDDEDTGVKVDTSGGGGDAKGGRGRGDGEAEGQGQGESEGMDEGEGQGQGQGKQDGDGQEGGEGEQGGEGEGPDPYEDDEDDGSEDDMGFTHYWRRTPRMARRSMWAVSRFAEAAIRQFEADYGEKIRGPFGYGDPIAWPEVVRFNGDDGGGDDDKSHETFTIPADLNAACYDPTPVDDNGRVFQCCKTARKPYDTLVTAVLAVASAVGGKAFVVTSDGDPSDWAEGVALANKILGAEDFRAGLTEREKKIMPTKVEVPKGVVGD